MSINDSSNSKAVLQRENENPLKIVYHVRRGEQPMYEGQDKQKSTAVYSDLIMFSSMRNTYITLSRVSSVNENSACSTRIAVFECPLLHIELVEERGLRFLQSSKQSDILESSNLNHSNIPPSIPNMDKAPNLPPEILELIIQHLVYRVCPVCPSTAHHMNRSCNFGNTSPRMFIKYIRNFRLVSKAFAEIGLRYLVSTIRLIRLPSSFDRAEQIANHPRARIYVKRLICYGNVIRSWCLLPQDKNRRQASVKDRGQDIHKVQQLIRRFPNLKTIRLNDWNEEHCVKRSRLRRAIAVTFGRLSRAGYDCDGFVHAGMLDLLHDAKGVEQLIISRVDGVMLRGLTYRCFSSLRKLAILVDHCDPWPLQMPVLWPGLEIFDLRCCLPDCMPIDFPLPKGLKCLGLSRVEFSAGYLPRTLSEICLADVRLRGAAMGRKGAPMSGWVDIFLNWPSDCELFLAGALMVEADDHHWYDCGRIPQDQILGSTVGQVLKEICSMPRSSTDDFREALLKQIFNLPPCSDRGDAYFDSSDICISSELKDRYELVDHPPTGNLYPEWARVMSSREYS